MPSGKVHDLITVVTATAAVAVWWTLTPRHDVDEMALTVGAYLFSGLWLSDDLDTRSVSYRRWGPLRCFWWPYQKLVPHRSWISHGIGIGPLLRVAYFAAVLWAACAGVSYIMEREGLNTKGLLPATHRLYEAGTNWGFAHPAWIAWLTIGLVLGGVTHSVADIVVSFARKVW